MKPEAKKKSKRRRSKGGRYGMVTAVGPLTLRGEEGEATDLCWWCELGKVVRRTETEAMASNLKSDTLLFSSSQYQRERDWSLEMGNLRNGGSD
jgi:hypothetical protein